jgi:Ni/Co efflux regulator RcnB
MRGRDGGDRRWAEGVPNGDGQPDGRRRDGDRPPNAVAPPQGGQGYAGRERDDAYGLRGGDDGWRGDDRRGDGRGRDRNDNDNRWREDGRNAYAHDRGGDRWNDRGRDYRRDDGRSRDGHGYRDRDHGRSWYSAGAYHQHYRAPYRYRAHAYRYPSGYFVRSWAFGEYLPRGWYTPTYYLDWRAFDLPYPPIGCEWVRVGDDALLVDVWTGEILSLYYDIFW